MTGRFGALRGDHAWSLDDVAALDGVALLEHVAQLLPADGRGPLPLGGEPLPDANLLDRGTLAWMGAALDGVMSLRGGRTEGPAPLQAAAATLDVLRHSPTTRSVHTLADRLAELTGPQDVDRFLAAITAERRLNRTRLAELSRWLCRHGTRRWHVKAGIAMLGISGDETDAALIARLGLLEELTLYALVALSRLLTQPEPAIFDLGRQVSGWGRIHAIHRLRGSTDPAVQQWLLRGGYLNEVMTEEVAFVAATTGGLAEALRGPIDDELLDGAGDLLAALATGGPSKDMRDYPDAEPALTAYFGHIALAAPSLGRLRQLNTLDAYLADCGDNPFIDESARTRLADHVAEILRRDDWRVIVERSLASESISDVRTAISLSDRFAIDPVPAAQRSLEREPHDGYLWQTLFQAAGYADVPALVELADRLLPFRSVAIGPADDLGLGPEYRAENCLDVILHGLRCFPGEGWSAIQLGLHSRVTRTRNTALHALSAWPRDRWPTEAGDAVAHLAWRDPSTTVRERARALLDPS
jgi:hypothetical protein